MNQSASLIIPYYKRAESIVRALKSVEHLLHIEEVVLVDDELSSESRIVLNAACQNFKKARIIENLFKKGALSARVEGALAANNDLIVFLDSDDEVEPKGVVQCLNTLDCDPDLCMAYGNVGFGDSMSSSSDFLRLTGFGYLQVLKNLSLCPFSGLCIRKSLIEWESLQRDLPAWQDDEFVLTASRSGKIQFIDCITAIMHDSGAGRISANKVAQLTGLRLLLEKWKGEIIENFGLSRFYLWKLRELSIMLRIASMNIGKRYAASSCTSKIILRCCSFAIYVAQRILGKVFEIFFDRVYA